MKHGKTQTEYYLRFAEQDGHESAPPRKQPTANSRLLPKIHFSEMQTAGSRLLFRPYLVIAQLPHEDFLVYRLPGVVEHRRDASRAANFRALPWHDDQRRGRFLIAQDGHAQRFSSRDGGQLRIFRLCL